MPKITQLPSKSGYKVLDNPESRVMALTYETKYADKVAAEMDGMLENFPHVPHLHCLVIDEICKSKCRICYCISVNLLILALQKS